MCRVLPLLRTNDLEPVLVVPSLSYWAKVAFSCSHFCDDDARAAACLQRLLRARGAARAARAQRPRNLSRPRLAPAAAAWGPCRGAGGRENARPSSRSRPLNILPHLVRLAGPRRAALASSLPLPGPAVGGVDASQQPTVLLTSPALRCVLMVTLALVPLLCLVWHAGQCFGDGPLPTTHRGTASRHLYEPSALLSLSMSLLL